MKKEQIYIIMVLDKARITWKLSHRHLESWLIFFFFSSEYVSYSSCIFPISSALESLFESPWVASHCCPNSDRGGFLFPTLCLLPSKVRQVFICVGKGERGEMREYCSQILYQKATFNATAWSSRGVFLLTADIPLHSIFSVWFPYFMLNNLLH